MAVSIYESIIQYFSFNGKSVRSVHVNGEECLISRDVYEAVGYDEQSGVQAIQRIVPKKYRIRFGDLLVKNDQLHHNTVLLKEAGLYCFLLRCKKQEQICYWRVFAKKFSQ